MNWLAKLLALIPVLVSGIEHIHGETMAGVDKKHLAMDALGLAGGVAGAVVPDNLQPAAAAAYQLASNVIDGTVAVMNATKNPPAATPAAPAGSAPSPSATQPAPTAAPSAPAVTS